MVSETAVDWSDAKHRRIVEDQRKFIWHADQLERLAAWIGLRAGMTLADVGCGQGYIGRAYLPYISPGGRVIGVDNNPRLIADARGLADATPSGDDFEYVVSDANNIPLPDASADAAYCQTLLMHVADPARVLREMVRITKPGGVVVASEPDHMPTAAGYESSAPFDAAEWLEDAAVSLQILAGRKKRGRGDYTIGSRLPEMMHDTGLTDIEIRANEKVSVLVPPYDTPYQRHVREMVLTNINTREEWADEIRDDYLAGGGDPETWRRLWDRWGERSRRQREALEKGELFLTAAGIFLVVRGRKPGE